MSQKLTVSLPGKPYYDAIGDVPEGVTLLTWDFESAPPADEIDIVVVPHGAPLSRLTEVTTTLVQGQAIGYDKIGKTLPDGLVFANAASVHEAATAELTLALILASLRDIPDYVRATDRGEWPAQNFTHGLADKRVLLVGVGGVGRAIEERLWPFEVIVDRVASHARSDERGVIHGIDELADLLPTADIVIVGVPLSENTTHLINGEFLAAMRDGALLVNISRGAVADTEALVSSATSGRLRFALDVTDPEPLPQGHPLLGLPNVLIAPHVGGMTDAMMPRLGRLILTQINRMLAGHEPINVVIRS